MGLRSSKVPASLRFQASRPGGNQGDQGNQVYFIKVVLIGDIGTRALFFKLSALSGLDSTVSAGGVVGTSGTKDPAKVSVTTADRKLHNRLNEGQDFAVNYLELRRSRLVPEQRDPTNYMIKYKFHLWVAWSGGLVESGFWQTNFFRGTSIILVVNDNESLYGQLVAQAGIDDVIVAFVTHDATVTTVVTDSVQAESSNRVFKTVINGVISYSFNFDYPHLVKEMLTDVVNEAWAKQLLVKIKREV